MKKNITFGIVQGRLIQPPNGQLQWFPQDQWEDEFSLASKLGFNFIELIDERQFNGNNPIWTDDGVEKIKYLTKKNNLSMNAFCTDNIIEHPISSDNSVTQHIIKVLERGELLGMKKLILPLFEHSELTVKNFPKYEKNLIKIADNAEEKNIMICLETVLNGKDLLHVLGALNHDNIKCVFDTGNRIAYGHDIYNDIKLLGNQIQHVHIKDKNEKNENVLLGTGKVNFYEVFSSLKEIRYNGPYTFETCRGKNPIRTAKYNMSLTNFFIEEVFDNEN